MNNGGDEEQHKPWTSLGDWEYQCIQHIESEPNFDEAVQREKDSANQKLWIIFQNSATSVAQLYRDRLQGGVSLWMPFQVAAGTITAMYRESTDSIRKCTDAGIQCGYQRRTRELLTWLKRNRRQLNREDLITYLSGKTPPPRVQSRNSPRQRLSVDYNRHESNHGQLPLHKNQPFTAHATEENLNCFQEALTHGTMGRRRGAAGQDLGTFMSNEFARHGKRPAPSSSPSHDVNMDSPTHKRSRLM